jgi:hypothetical protein
MIKARNVQNTLFTFIEFSLIEENPIPNYIEVQESAITSVPVYKRPPAQLGSIIH